MQAAFSRFVTAVMSVLVIALVTALLTVIPSSAAPEGGWPPEAHGLPLPTPGWILVIPATRGDDGQVRAWTRDDQWSRQWVVPRGTPGGTRTVAALGDSEDSRTVTGWLLDSMDAASLSALAAKYGAPAVAVAVIDASGAVAVAGWTREGGASWLEGKGGDPREAALQAMDGIFAGGEAVSDFDVAITGQRQGPGGMEYRVEAAGIVIETLHGLGSLDVSAYGEPGVAVVSVRDGRDIEEVLRSAGIRVRGR